MGGKREREKKLYKERVVVVLLYCFPLMRIYATIHLYNIYNNNLGQ